MNIIQLAWKYIQQNRANSLLGILLAAFGTAILCILMLTASQLENQLENNSRGIDLVVGAKGSPTQLILSSIYHMDNPTGNISYAEAQKLSQNRFVKRAVPLALGDNFKGHRIVGTDTSFMSLYQLHLKEGKLWKKDFDAVIGAQVAETKGLKVGDQFHSAHGFSEDGHSHGDHPYTVTGILSSSGKVPDRLILSNISSVWAVHGLHDHENDHDHNHDHGHNHHHDHDHGHDHSTTTESDASQEEELVEEVFVKSMGEGMVKDQGPEITALLIQYTSPAALSILPKSINQDTEMQAASPAFESARLFSLLGIGFDSLEILAYVIMFMAAFSVFISLYNAFKSRKYDLAIMRTMGASRIKLFGMIITEGILITGIGAVTGIILGHLAMYFIAKNAGNAGSLMNALAITSQEWLLVVIGLLIGLFAALIPGIKAYNTSISKTLSEN